MAEEEQQATNVVVVGMAGCGKTTFMQRVVAHLHERTVPAYVINLDPAVTHMPFGANIDIRDTVNYKEVMKQYQLGPNGAIMTSLNLFSTRFDQVISLVESRAKEVKYVLVDTPGQIEVFNWSASGTIITEALASTGPTVLVYVVDTPRSSNVTTFMSNMLYACSILYKSRLPMVVAFNKIDVASHQQHLLWMTDFDSFQQAVDGDCTYMADLTRSMSLSLDEFYKTLRSVGVSAVTGEGMDDLLAAIDSAREEYNTGYKAALDRRVAKKEEAALAAREEQLARMRMDRDC
mmetsp:Transcript_19409/g.74521  ORF Transcript_19409/g.74521 Transcript_19409/m.74521 type:complete len:291 (+) Transcript_19409:20-892(+)